MFLQSTELLFIKQKSFLDMRDYRTLTREFEEI